MGQYPQSTTPTTSPGLRTTSPWEDGKTGSARPDGCWRRKERTPLMKLRCERDVLAEALATAGRAVASRGTLPVLSGVRLEPAGDPLTITGSDLEPTVPVHTAVAGLAAGENGKQRRRERDVQNGRITSGAGTL